MRSSQRTDTGNVGEIAAGLRGERPLPEHAVAVTFDDAYDDTLARSNCSASAAARKRLCDNRSDRQGAMIRREQLCSSRREPATVEMGAHTVTHPPLDELELEEIRARSVGEQAEPWSRCIGRKCRHVRLSLRRIRHARAPSRHRRRLQLCGGSQERALPYRGRPMGDRALDRDAPPPARADRRGPGRATEPRPRGTVSGCAHAATGPCASSGADRSRRRSMAVVGSIPSS